MENQRIEESKIMKKPYRIGLIGCAGLGKSSIAAKIAEEMKLPFLNSKGITRPVLKRQGWDHSINTCVEKILAVKDVEFDLVSRRLEEESLLQSGFVTDRTTLECFCYSFLCYYTYSKDDLSLLEKTCKGNMKNYSHLFYIPLKEAWYEDNGVRTTDVNFQRMIDLMIRGTILDWKIQVSEVPELIIRQHKTIEYILSRVKEGESE